MPHNNLRAEEALFVIDLKNARDQWDNIARKFTRRVYDYLVALPHPGVSKEEWTAAVKGALKWFLSPQGLRDYKISQGSLVTFLLRAALAACESKDLTLPSNLRGEADDVLVLGKSGNQWIVELLSKSAKVF